MSDQDNLMLPSCTSSSYILQLVLSVSVHLIRRHLDRQTDSWKDRMIYGNPQNLCPSKHSFEGLRESFCPSDYFNRKKVSADIC